MANPISKLLLLRAMLITFAGCWVFAPALGGGWLIDDDVYLTRNVLLNDPARLWKIWFQPGSQLDFYPIEATLQFAQWRLWGTATPGYHLTNLLLHLLGAFLVWKLLAKFDLRFAWLGGLLFAIHPVVVESVAWISEFKNVLSLPPFLLAMICWINFEEHRRPRDYALALGWFLLAMLCKISMALFPFIILLYTWWKRGRLGWGDFKAATPFFLISFALGLATVVSGHWFREFHHQHDDAPALGGLLPRLALTGTSLVFYLSKCLLPFDLLPVYPQWKIDPPSPLQLLTWPLLFGFAIWFWTKRATWGRHALLGMGFFVLNLLPFIGFISTTYMGFTWVMDHFLYLPLIGLIGLAIALLDVAEPRLSAPLFTGTVALVMALLAWESHTYASHFTSQETLWTYTIERNPTAWIAHNDLGNVYFETGRIEQAILQYQQALQAKPDNLEAHHNLGLALSQQKRYPEAIAQFESALQTHPAYTLALVHLANALAESGQIAEARARYEQALQIDPTNPEAQDNLTKLPAPPKN